MSVILSSKHIKLNDSLVGTGAMIIEALREPKNLEELWTRLRADRAKKKLRGRLDLEKVILAVDFLFSIGVVAFDEAGRLKREAD